MVQPLSKADHRRLVATLIGQFRAMVTIHEGLFQRLGEKQDKVNEKVCK